MLAALEEGGHRESEGICLCRCCYCVVVARLDFADRSRQHTQKPWNGWYICRDTASHVFGLQ